MSILPALDEFRGNAPGVIHWKWTLARERMNYCRKSGAVNRAGIPKFDPPNPFKIANVIPITFPSEFSSGPPLPPT